jgi:hypothetical protein
MIWVLSHVVENELGQYLIPILIIAAVGIFVGSRILIMFR